MKKRKQTETLKVDRCSSWFPSREWLEQRNLKVVYDGSHRGWHLELNNPHVPSGKRPKCVLKPLTDPEHPEIRESDGKVVFIKEIDTKIRKRERR